MLRKLKWQILGEPLAARYNWCRGPVPGRGPAVEKQCSKSAYWLGFRLKDIWIMLRFQTRARCGLFSKRAEKHWPTPSRLIQGSFVGLRCLWVWNQSNLLPVPKFKNEWSYTVAVPYALIFCHLFNDRETCTFPMTSNCYSPSQTASSNFQCFTVHFFISLNVKLQHNALHTQQ